MKGAIQTSAVLLPLALSVPAQAYPKKHGGGQSTTSGGNHVQNTYTFSKDKFGNNDVLNLGAQTGIQGGGTKGRRDLEEDFELYIREASPEPKKHKAPPAQTSGGNQVQTTYTFNKDKFGDNDVLNLGAATSVQGGGTKSRRALEDFELYIREASAEPKKHKAPQAQTSGGNQVQTTYTFNKDKFGDNDVLNLGAQTGIQGGGTKGRRSLEDFELYIREASPEPKKHKAPPQAQTSGGNHVETVYKFDKSQFGNNDVLNLGAQTGIQGGGTKGRRALEDFDLYVREIEEEMLYGRDAEAEPFLNGGPAQGGNSNTNGGNHNTNTNSLSKTPVGPGSTINMGNSNFQQGGNTIGGNGGANSGNGGKGGSFSMPVQMPSMPGMPKRWILERREIGDHGIRHGGNHASSFTQIGPDGVTVQSSIRQKGGNIHGKNGAANTANGADAPSIAIARRWLEAREAEAEAEAEADADADAEAEAEAEAFLNGGGASGGSSNTNGGNHSNNNNSIKGGKIGPGSTINMSNQNSQVGGNTKGGNGGANYGKGGGGGSFSMPIQMPPIPMRRRALEALYAREAEAEPGFLDGGGAHGGDSKTHGGNHSKNNNSVKGAKAGPNSSINMGNSNSQTGGNTRGGNGGANYGHGGAGGSLSVPISMPPIPMRRDLEYLEYLEARDAFADADAEAEPFLDGGKAKGGDSKTHGGNHSKNNNSVKGAKVGPGSSINMGNTNSQSGGNTVGGNGGANYGNGGAGGSFSVPISMPPIPMRRDLEYLEARDELDVYVGELFARDAYADPEADAEPEDFDMADFLYARDVELDSYAY